MKTAANASDKGILRAAEGKKRFELLRFEPSGDLAFFVEHYWMVKYDLRGQEPYRQTILSYPSVQLAFESDPEGVRTLLYGVPSVPFTRLLRDAGTVLGVKFKPGGFYPFWQKPVSRLTGLTLPAGELFGLDMEPIERRLFAEEDGEKMAALAEAFLRERLPQRDENAEWIGGIVDTVFRERDFAKVEQLAERFGTSMRALQRLFSRYVGVSPKWVVRRFRLQEAAEKMEQGDPPDWARLSAELGYYDQAHFIKDFKAMTGQSPEAYTRDVGQSR